MGSSDLVARSLELKAENQSSVPNLVMVVGESPLLLWKLSFPIYNTRHIIPTLWTSVVNRNIVTGRHSLST